MATNFDIEDTIAREGRLTPRPRNRWPRVVTAAVDFDLLYGGLAHHTNDALVDHLPLRNLYTGTDAEITAQITDDIDEMINQAINELWNRLRLIAETYDHPLRINTFQRKAPSIGNFQIPRFIASVLSGIGPIRVNDTLRDVTVIYAPSREYRDQFGRDHEHPVNASAVLRIMNRMTAAAIPMASIISRGSEGSFFTTCSVVQYDIDTYEVQGVFHHTHYNRNDIAAALLFGQLGSEENPFEDLSVTIGFVGDESVITPFLELPTPPECFDAEQPGRHVGGTYCINDFGIAQPNDEPIPGRGRGIYVLGRSRDAHLTSSLARGLSMLEMLSILRHRILHGGGPAPRAANPRVPPPADQVPELPPP